MNKKYKAFFLLYTLLIGIILFKSDNLMNYSNVLNYVQCGAATGIPRPIPQMTTVFYTLLVVGTPLILIAFSIVTLIKAIVSGKADEVMKAKNKLFKKFLIAGIIFLIASIVQFIILRVVNTNDDKASVSSCLKCFLYYSEKNCLESDTGNDINKNTQNKHHSDQAGSLKEPSSSNNDSSNSNNQPSSNSNSDTTSTSELGLGKGKAEKITIKYNVKDKAGRCGKGANDYCAAVATVKYPKETITYYMGYQNNSQLLTGSCRSHAFMAAANAINDTKYSTLDLQKYLYSTGNKGILKAKGIPKAINKYNLKAKIYHSETSRSKSAKLIKKALDNGQPVMIFVANSLCNDLAGSHHALLLLGYDSKGNVIFIDSVPYSKNAKKRNVDELAKCLSGDSIADNYYRMIIFSF